MCYKFIDTHNNDMIDGRVLCECAVLCYAVWHGVYNVVVR